MPGIVESNWLLAAIVEGRDQKEPWFVIEMPDFGGNAVTSFPPAGSGRLDPSEIGRRLDCCLFAPLIVYIYIYICMRRLRRNWEKMISHWPQNEPSYFAARQRSTSYRRRNKDVGKNPWNWEIVSDEVYLPDVISSDCHLFRSIGNHASLTRHWRVIDVGQYAFEIIMGDAKRHPYPYNLSI